MQFDDHGPGKQHHWPVQGEVSNTGGERALALRDMREQRIDSAQLRDIKERGR